MRSAHYERLQSVLVEEEAMLRLAERIGRFTIRSGEALPGAVEDGFPRRHRDAMHACSGYFSAPLLRGDSRLEGVESFAENAAFVEAALRLYGLPLVRPVAVTANPTGTSHARRAPRGSAVAPTAAISSSIPTAAMDVRSPCLRAMTRRSCSTPIASSTA
jgi:hypothetical protein